MDFETMTTMQLALQNCRFVSWNDKISLVSFGVFPTLTTDNVKF